MTRSAGRYAREVAADMFVALPVWLAFYAAMLWAASR